MPDHATPPGTISVSHARHVLAVEAGSSVSFGRGGECDLPMTSDRFVSRHAGDIEVSADAVIVWNRSTSKPLVVRPPLGADIVVEPGSGHAPVLGRVPTFDVLLLGTGGRELTVRVDARGLGSPETAPKPASVRAGSSGQQPDTDRVEPAWRPSQRRVLAALCEPVLTLRGPLATPASYRRIAARLGLAQGYVRNVVRGIRDELSPFGLPGLAPDGRAEASDFRSALAELALRHQWVTLDDIDELDDLHREGG